MIFTKLIIALISPLGAALVLSFLALLLGFFGRMRLAFVLGAIGLLWLYAWSLPVMSAWICDQLQSDYPPTLIHDVPQADAIVVLGGAISPADSHRLAPDLTRAADRIWYAAKLFNAGKAPLIVLSGGSDSSASKTSEAEAMRFLLRDLGVPETAMLLERESNNTRENAHFSAMLLHKRDVHTILLVTSAMHMRRALTHFSEERLDVIPAATDYEVVKVNGWRQWIPSADKLYSSAQALKELVGHMIWRR
ncbi:hypothetical protein MMIC_P0852 [Mariprofundus micogutta]|uniref:DUF218 domain-containing protein n=1 Tax=Mariprofundus micogutta TaxID=1921010 RepID=A0A1L8CLW1_9PROT|nr:YdcF family protein [Mariprofundus micogutta]GAV19894.1 hypothetical protein MMIC_P0852 [Mariprofundus micogutta]